MSAKKKTTDKIKTGLIEMLATSSIDDITATALCERAGVNRATFYYHYNSVYDVLAEIEKQVESEFAQWLSQSIVDNAGAPAKNFYVSFFEFVRRNADVCRILLTSHNRSDFLMRALDAGRSKVISGMTRLFPDCPTSKIEYYYIFVSNGFIGLLRYWLGSGMIESIETIADIGERVSSMGIEYLK